MKILVTGADGQLGTTFCEMARQGGAEVVACNRQKLDITDLEKVVETVSNEKPTFVLNAAAYTAVDKAESDKENAFLINQTGAKNLAIACAENDIPLVHISTDYVFNGQKSSPYVEEDESCPINVYGESKWEGEQAIRAAHDKHIILRVSWVFGVHGHNFVKTVQRLAREQETFKIVADQQGCPAATAHISQVVLKIAEHFSDSTFSDYGTYHYCDSPATNWCEFAKAIVEETRVYEKLAVKNIGENTTAGYPTPATRPPNSRMDCSKLEKTFGIKQFAWRDALKEVVKKLHESN